MNINELIDRAWKNSEDRGFHEVRDHFLSIENYERLEPHLITAQLALIGSEVSEAVQAVQRGKFISEISLDNLDVDSPEFEKLYVSYVKNTLPAELADTVIRIADFCGTYGIDLNRYIEIVMAYNAKRERMHGKLL